MIDDITHKDKIICPIKSPYLNILIQDSVNKTVNTNSEAVS